MYKKIKLIKIILPLVISIILISDCSKSESSKKKNAYIFSILMFNNQKRNTYFCDRKVTCRQYPTSYVTQNGKYACSFDSTNSQLQCSLTSNTVSGQGNLTYYYNNKSDFIDESACIGLIKRIKTTYQGTSIDGNLNGTSQSNTFNSQGYPQLYLDIGLGTVTAKSWDAIGRPLTTSSFTDGNGCSAYLQYSYDDANLILYADFVRTPSTCLTPQYSPNSRIFNQDYNEIQRNTFTQDSTGKITSNENITINSTTEICK